jgi:transcriptional regulator with XRE-family HTH domain
MRDLSEILRAGRARSGLSLAELGERLGVHRQVVYHWEHGNCEPSWGDLQRLAAVLRLPLAALRTLSPAEARRPKQFSPASGRRHLGQ